MSEVWKPVPGYEGVYEISSAGRVRRLAKEITYVNRWGSETTYTKSALEIKPWAQRSGHLNIDLYRGDGSHERFRLHRMVLSTFVGPCPEGMVACHEDGDPTNNALSNLRWDTPGNNFQDSVRHGTAYMGERQHMAKLREVDIPLIRNAYENGTSQSKIATEFGVCQRTISMIVTGRTWKAVK